MNKCNNKSIRLNDKVFDYIINYKGDGFNQKFENIILYAMETEADRKKRITELDNLIQLKHEEIEELNKKILKLRDVKLIVDDIINNIINLNREVDGL